MSKMKELYAKVAGDAALQAKFADIMKDAEKAGEAATKEKLTAFAKEAGYDASVEEAQEFFGALSEKKEGSLSEEELDRVAGGKVGPGGPGDPISAFYICKPNNSIAIRSCEIFKPE